MKKMSKIMSSFYIKENHFFCILYILSLLSIPLKISAISKLYFIVFKCIKYIPSSMLR